MKKNAMLFVVIVCLVLLISTNSLSHSAGAEIELSSNSNHLLGDGSSQWAVHLGGANADLASAIVQTGDGGYAMAGYTGSFGAGNVDLWVVKINSNGSIAWEKTYGDSNLNFASTMTTTADGGFMVAGSTGNYHPQWFGYWVLRLDSNGEVLWQKKFGSGGTNFVSQVIETSNGDFLMVGETGTFSTPARGWILKLDANGNSLWQKIYGGSETAKFYSVQETSEGYMVAGYLRPVATGKTDAWVVNLDTEGNITWQKSYQAPSAVMATSIKRSLSGNYIVAGQYNSSSGYSDFWVIMLEPDGDILWQKSLLRIATYDTAWAVEETSDGNIILVGEIDKYTASSAFWVVKWDANGNLLWQKTYGGIGVETAYAVTLSEDGDLVVAGSTESFTFPNISSYRSDGQLVPVPSPSPFTGKLVDVMWVKRVMQPQWIPMLRL